MAIGIFARRLAMAVALAAAFAGPTVAHAVVIDPWVHDHSDAGVPPRPSGYSELVQTFGQPCSDRANNSRSWWPSQSARNVAGYVYYHPYIARDVGYNIRNHVAHDHNDGAVDYLVGAYNCRHDPWVDIMVGARLRGGHRHQLCSQSARSIRLERQGRRRLRLRPVPPERVARPLPGPRVLLGDQLGLAARSHAFPVRDRLLMREGS